MKKHFKDQIWNGLWQPLSTPCCNGILVSSTERGETAVCTQVLLEALSHFISQLSSTGQGLHVCWPPSFSITPAKSSRVLDCHCSPGTVEPDVNSLLPLHRQPLGEAGGVTNLFFLTSLFMDNILHCQHFFWQKELELKKPDHKLVRPERHSSYFLLCPFTTVTPWTKVHSSLAVSVNGRSFTASFSLCWAPKWDGVAWWGHLLT